MVQVISSYTVGVVQEDGRSPIVEKHVAEGFTHVYEYLSDGSIDPQVILDARAAHIQKTLEDREAARQLAIGTPVALNKSDFLDRFTAAERIAASTLAETDPVVADFMLLLNNASLILMPKAMPGLLYLQSVGILTEQRVTEIGTE